MNWYSHSQFLLHLGEGLVTLFQGKVNYLLLIFSDIHIILTVLVSGSKTVVKRWISGALCRIKGELCCIMPTLEKCCRDI